MAAEAEAHIVIERTYRAPARVLWDLWTTKDGFESWWGPQGFRAEVSLLDARQDGALRYEMIADTPEMIAAMQAEGRPASHETRAMFTEFRPHERLVITHVIDFLPGVATYESTMTVQFLPSPDSQVRMVVTMSPMHHPSVSRMQLEGFTSQLSKLDRRFQGEL